MGAYALITSNLAGEDAGASRLTALAAGSRGRWTECNGLVFLRVNSWAAIEETLGAARSHPLPGPAIQRTGVRALRNVRAAIGQIEDVSRRMREAGLALAEGEEWRLG